MRKVSTVRARLQLAAVSIAVALATACGHGSPRSVPPEAPIETSTPTPAPGFTVPSPSEPVAATCVKHGPVSVAFDFVRDSEAVCVRAGEPLLVTLPATSGDVWRTTQPPATDILHVVTFLRHHDGSVAVHLQSTGAGATMIRFSMSPPMPDGAGIIATLFVRVTT